MKKAKFSLKEKRKIKKEKKKINSNHQTNNEKKQIYTGKMVQN